jgi:Putative phage tail protein
MATVVLSVVGTILGGPVGGAIGAAIGQQIDKAIIGPGKPREGPRLKELELQTSSYGTQIPKIFGAMRVAGTVIWSTDLIERRVKTGGGKSTPATINYTYSASFAVALSSRPIGRIGRIWADGNLLRGAAGDFKVETGFRFYSGQADQTLDPLIASAVGQGACPAFRDTAYVVFEDFQLADFGNRIPSLTFEVFERETPVPVSDIASVASYGAITGSSAENIAGYALQGDNAEAALRPLLDAMPVIVRPFENHLQLIDWFAEDVTEHALLPIANVNGDRVERPQLIRQPDDRLPSAIAIRHFEPARDYQAGTQQSLQIGQAQKFPIIDLPAANSGGETKRLAQLTLLQSQMGRQGYAAHGLIEPQLPLAGEWVTDTDFKTRIIEIEKFLGWYQVQTQHWLDKELNFAGTIDVGQSLPSNDVAIGATRLVLLDLPALGNADPGQPQIFAATAGTGAGWRRANLSLVAGEDLVDLGGTAPSAIMGALSTTLPPHQPYLIDWQNQPVVELLNDAMTLPLGPGDSTLKSAPAISLNGEIMRYATAEFLGGRNYRLKGLLRGTAGSEYAIVMHPAGSKMVLLDEDAMRPIDRNYITLSSIITVEAIGLGDTMPVADMLLIEGNAIRPFAPAHGKVFKDAAGNRHVHWIRRNRIDGGWQDEVDMVMSEDTLLFDVTLRHNGLPRQSWQSTAEQMSISATELGSLQIPQGAALQFEIRQVGRYARSKPLMISTVN